MNLFNKEENLEIIMACTLQFKNEKSNTINYKKSLTILEKYFKDEPEKINKYLSDLSGKESSWSPLMTCCYYEFSQGVDFLLKNGANPNFIGKDKMSPLIISSIKNQGLNLINLLKNKADVNHQDKIGMTALMHACEKGTIENVKIILAATPNLEIKDNENKSFKDHAVNNSHLTLNKFLDFYYLNNKVKNTNTKEIKKTKI